MSAADEAKSLRAAAARLATREAEIVGVDPVEKPALLALFEQAFPDDDRGLTYPREIDDIGDWLTSVRRVDEEE